MEYGVYVFLYFLQGVLAELEEFLCLFGLVGKGVDVERTLLDGFGDGFEALQGFGIGFGFHVCGLLYDGGCFALGQGGGDDIAGFELCGVANGFAVDACDGVALIQYVLRAG